MTTLEQTSVYPGVFSTKPVLQQFIKALIRWQKSVFYLVERQKQRGQLLKLEEHRLDDIGITREEADKEGSKRFWQD